MAPFPQVFSHDTTDKGSNANPVTPEVIAGLTFSGAILLGVGVWLGIRYYRKRTRQPTDIIVRGVISEGDEKISTQKCVSLCLLCRPMFLSSRMAADFPPL